MNLPRWQNWQMRWIPVAVSVSANTDAGAETAIRLAAHHIVNVIVIVNVKRRCCDDLDRTFG